MKLKYNKEYFDNYYDGSYEDTFKLGYSLKDIIAKCWTPRFKELPKSFADIGAGPGQTLLEAQKILGSDARIYGVEVQEIPKERVVSNKVIFGDFLEVKDKLEPTELVYVACSMYVPWNEQVPFLKAALGLAQKAICFANLYLTDRQGIPEDRLRQTIYKSRPQFIEAMQTLGWTWVKSPYDFFVRK